MATQRHVLEQLTLPDHDFPTPEWGAEPCERRPSSAAAAANLLETQIIRHPVVSIAAALTLGVIVGWLIKRR